MTRPGALSKDPGSTSVLIGPSGVGKSTLVNALLGEDRLAAGPVRAGDANHKLRREAEIHEIRHDASKARLSRTRERHFAKLCRAEQKRKKR